MCIQSNASCSVHSTNVNRGADCLIHAHDYAGEYNWRSTNTPHFQSSSQALLPGDAYISSHDHKPNSSIVCCYANIKTSMLLSTSQQMLIQSSCDKKARRGPFNE
uniref:Uncharacterized protein n=1 Tax=Chlamydomonas chlamydogama TaxID=225041 RepID=A0A6T5TLL9_9CHLO|mmetsp:Transcript_1298/g.2822  ORF Transcript_1298/g.2822 Transcript_1298/m.2822 type:complete len:105 (+) Transcript_1298:1426-1740(+)